MQNLRGQDRWGTERGGIGTEETQTDHSGGQDASCRRIREGSTTATCQQTWVIIPLNNLLIIK